MNNGNNPISKDMIEQFRDTGAVVVRGLIPSAWLTKIENGLQPIIELSDDYSNYYDSDDLSTTSATNAVQKKIVPSNKRKDLVRQNAWQISDVLREFYIQSSVSKSAALLFGSSQVTLYEDLMLFKSGVDTSVVATPWHQDEPQWPLTGRMMCSAWFCLDPVTRDTGALRFVSGSHRGPMYRPYVPPSRESELEADCHFFTGGELPDVEGNPDQFRVICFDTNPGDVVFFHPRCLHASFGGSLEHPRRTFSIRYLGDDVRWQPKKTVMYDWLKDVSLAEGDPVSGVQFPVLWPCKDNIIQTGVS